MNSKRVLLTATVQSHICQFHKPLVSVLHNMGCEVHVAARNNLAEKNGLSLDFVDKVYDIPFSRSPKSIDNLLAYKELKKILRETHYDVIHCNTPMGGIITRFAARKSRRKGTKVIYTVHGFHFYKGAPLKNWLIFYPVERFFSRYTDILITITREDYNLASRKMKCNVRYISGVGVNEERFKVATEEQKQLIRKELGFNPSQKIILCVGELLPNKNQVMAIKAMTEVVKQYPDALMLFAGNGPTKDSLEKQIKALALENNVKLLGYVTNLQDFQEAADAQVACSCREGLPLNVVEAMLSGNIVVASDNRGHRELIQDGETGYLVQLNDASTMARRLIEAFDNQCLKSYIEKLALTKACQYGNINVMMQLKDIYSSI